MRVSATLRAAIASSFLAVAVLAGAGTGVFAGNENKDDGRAEAALRNFDRAMLSVLRRG